MSKPMRSSLIHHLVRAAAFAGYAFFIVHLVRSGSIGLYIAPRMEMYVKLSALALYAAASCQAYQAFRIWIDGSKEADCDCGHAHGPSPSVWKNVLVNGLFVLPVVLGFLMPDATLGSSLADKKGMALGGAEIANRWSAGDAAPQRPDGDASADATSTEGIDPDNLFPADEYTAAHAEYGKRLYKMERIAVQENLFIETLTTLDLYRQRFVGKTVEIRGFVYREEGMGTDRFAVGRFAMNCCSADSMPYGLLTEWPEAYRLHPDQWVRVSGKLTTADFNGDEVLLLQAETVEEIEAPESPYVYPNAGFDEDFAG
jgi:TIGR03943 family protein